MSFSLVNAWELSRYTLFDNIPLPPNIEKDILINTIFDECAEFEPYSIDIPLLHAKILYFFKRHYNEYDRMIKALLQEYNPLENYDKMSEITTDYNRDLTSKDDSTNDAKVSAYDSSTLQPNTQDTYSDVKSDTIKDNTKMVERTHGNIGVMTSTQMLESEISVRSKLNIYKHITNDFIRELMICVW